MNVVWYELAHEVPAAFHALPALFPGATGEQLVAAFNNVGGLASRAVHRDDSKSFLMARMNLSRSALLLNCTASETR